MFHQILIHNIHLMDRNAIEPPGANLPDFLLIIPGTAGHKLIALNHINTLDTKCFLTFSTKYMVLTIWMTKICYLQVLSRILFYFSKSIFQIISLSQTLIFIFMTVDQIYDSIQVCYSYLFCPCFLQVFIILAYSQGFV